MGRGSVLLSAVVIVVLGTTVVLGPLGGRPSGKGWT
jgi:hypothetical protein